MAEHVRIKPNKNFYVSKENVLYENDELYRSEKSHVMIFNFMYEII